MSAPPGGGPAAAWEAAKEAPGLGVHAARGGITLAAAAAIEQGSLLIRVVILTRLLSPAEFGIMGMALVAVRAGEAVSQTLFVAGRRSGLPLGTLFRALAPGVAASAAMAWLLWLPRPHRAGPPGSAS